MAAPSSLDVLLKGDSGRSTRGLLRIIILLTIAAAAVASRLFSVIRTSQSDMTCSTHANCAFRVRKYYSRMYVSIVVSLRLYNVSHHQNHQLPDINPCASIVDPWFNFRATKYLVENGFYSFWDWFDDRMLSPSPSGCASPQV